MGLKQQLKFVGGLLVVFVLFLGGCTTGPMTVEEVHYWAVPNGENTNYYRLRVKAKTKLGVSEYRSGWFPGRSVDALFGDVSAEGGARDLAVRSELENQISQKIISTNQAWLEEAAKPNPVITKLDGLLQARRRVLAYPSGNSPPYKGAHEIEFNPAQGIHTRYSDEKLLFVLASNPDEVIEKIANFAESDKTVLSIQRLSDVMAQRGRSDIAAQEASEEVNKRFDDFVVKQIELARKVIDNDNKAVARTEAIREIETLVLLVKSVRP